jgi:PAS domain S-box-containing protein
MVSRSKLSEPLAAAWLAAIVESSDDAIASKTLDGIVTSWNPAAEKLFGYTAEEMVGRPIAILAAPDRVNEMPAILESIRRGEKVDHYETVRRRKDGSLIDISLTSRRSATRPDASWAPRRSRATSPCESGLKSASEC